MGDEVVSSDSGLVDMSLVAFGTPRYVALRRGAPR